MPNINDLDGVVAKELHVYYVLDTSVSMHDASIAALNDAMRRTLQILWENNKTDADADLKIGVLTFNSDVEWITVNSNGDPAVQDIEDFFWSDLEAKGLASLGKALEELNQQLSRSKMQYSATGNKAPLIIFMSDGSPTDDWENALEELRQNNWYNVATKIAFALGDNSDTSVLAKVIGTQEAVIQTNDLESIREMIRVVTYLVGEPKRKMSDTASIVGTEIIRKALVDWVDIEDSEIDFISSDGLPEDISAFA